MSTSHNSSFLLDPPQQALGLEGPLLSLNKTVEFVRGRQRKRSSTNRFNCFWMVLIRWAISGIQVDSYIIDKAFSCVKYFEQLWIALTWAHIAECWAFIRGITVHFTFAIPESSSRTFWSYHFLCAIHYKKQGRRWNGLLLPLDVGNRSIVASEQTVTNLECESDVQWLRDTEPLFN